MAFNPTGISKADAAAYSSSEEDEDEDNDILVPSTGPRDEFSTSNPRKRRRTGRNAKESAALGIFGSDSEDDGPARKWKSKNNLRHSNMTFVSGGKQGAADDIQTDQPEGMKEDPGDEDDGHPESVRTGLGAQQPPETASGDSEDDYDPDDEMKGSGLGFHSSGLGFPPPEQSTAPATRGTPSKPTSRPTKHNARTPLGQGFVPSSAKDPILREDLRDADTSTPMASKAGPSNGGGGKAKGFAARMMAKMGYVEGQGLGAQNQGRNIIIEANLRPQGVGLGAVKEKSATERKEEKRQARLRGEIVSDSEDETSKQKKKRERAKKQGGVDSGPASGTQTPRRPKTKFMTVSDVQKAAPGLHIPDAFAPILDLTGRDHKLLTSSSGLLTPTAGTELTEQSESRKLARRAQGELAGFVEEWKSLESRKAWLDMESHQRQQELEELEVGFSQLQVFSSTLDQICQAAQDHEWDPIMASLKKAEESPMARDENLSAIAVAAVHPFVSNAVQGWQPLEDPKLGNLSTDLLAIQGVLGLKRTAQAVARWEDDKIGGTHRHHQRATTPYESMIYKHLFPKLITTISQTWDVYDPTPLLGILDKWDSLLPGFIRSQLMEQVVRRLSEAVNSWRPKKKQHNLPHRWLFPWLPHLPPHHLEPKGTGLVGEVRRKFRQLIDMWDFDRGLIPGLEKWKDVFRPSRDQDQWTPLVMNHVLPSMARYLNRRFKVDPAEQEAYIDMLHGACSWTKIISARKVGEVIIAEVFPKWHGVLYDWLTSDEADYDEIAQWFEFWDEVLPPEIKSLESIRAEFSKGQELIEKALELGPEGRDQLRRPDRGPAHQPRKEHRHHHPQTKRPDARNAEAPTANTTQAQAPEAKERTFRHDVDDWCQENDLQFIRIGKANAQGRPYFRITPRMDGKGGVLSYFEANVLVVELKRRSGMLRVESEKDLGGLLEQLYAEEK